jgi:serine/threonine-protein kinase
LVGVLGEGGFGAVYKAIQQPVGRPVALKLIASDIDDPNLPARFAQEARVVAGLKDTSIVTLYDYGAEPDGTLFMVFELIEGMLLNKVFPRGTGWPPERAARLMLQVLNGLGEAHKMGLVHRDLKPENIMVLEGGAGGDKAKVLDFGIAKVVGCDDDGLRTREGIVLGTPRYMSPEQSQDLLLDGRSDLYSLGVILYEMVVGHPPFTEGAAIEILMAHISTPPPPIPRALGLSASIEAVIMRALSKKADQRYADASEMAKALNEALKGGPQAQAGPAYTTLVDGDQPGAPQGLPATIVLDDAEKNELAAAIRPLSVPPLVAEPPVLEAPPQLTDETPNFANVPSIRPPKRGGSGKKVALLIGAVVLSVAIAVGVWFAVGGKTEVPAEPVKVRIGN